MIKFRTIRWKNLLSTGDAFTEIQLDQYQNTLIVGSNGAGKSTILDALTFVLFGKAFRKINKPALVNSVNQKNCVVEIEFETSGKQYKVIRGIKPAIFEIYCDDVCLNQNSTTKDYQEHLEKFILRMSYKSFTQVVILGSASFTPFMQLSPADRRGVIEDLLDIQIFSVMNTIAKQRLQENKEKIEKNKIESLGKEEKKEFIERNLKKLQENSEVKIKQLTENKKKFLQDIEAYQSEIDVLDAQREKLLKTVTSAKSVRDRHSKLLGIRGQIKSNIERHKTEMDFYHKNDNCPTCQQAIQETLKTHRIDVLSKTILKLEQDGLEKITSEIDACVKTLDIMDRKLTKIESLGNQIEVNKIHIGNIKSGIYAIERDIDGIQNTNDLLYNNEKELKETEAEIDRITKEKQDLLEDRTYISTALTLLKDGGIKTKIIKQYLPIINKMINKYLLQMGFFVNFNIDENFEESIKSRYRDDFSYQSFSEGEKMKIDLAILFAWRAVAKMKNSVNTNLLLLDEIFDSSLDSNGTDEFLKIMWSLTGDTNVIVISHKQDQLIEKFQRVVRFEKQKNFSRMI